MSKKVVVVGSGFGGLAAAVRLAARGHDVTVPLAVVRVLEDAVETQVRQKVGSVGVETQVTTKNVPRFNWYFVDERPRKRA